MEVKFELEKRSELKAVSLNIPSFTGVTRGQNLLLEMLSKHLNENRPIEKNDILNCYISAVAPSGVKKVWEYQLVEDKYEYVHVEVDFRNHYSAERDCITWFKNNLGSCILKGKLLAIPVIEI